SRGTHAQSVSPGSALRWALRSAVVAAIAAAALTLPTISRSQGELCALAFGVGGAAVILVRRPDGGPTAVSEVIRSPWLVLGCAMLMGAVVPPVDGHLRGAQLVTSPASVALVALGGTLAFVALAGLVEQRCPGQGLVVVLGEGILPIAGAFVVWLLALQRPGFVRLGPLGGT